MAFTANKGDKNHLTNQKIKKKIIKKRKKKNWHLQKLKNLETGEKKGVSL